MKKRFRKGIFVVVHKKGKSLLSKDEIKYLLLKRKLHWKGWEFPKGGVEKGERFLDVVRREVKEETGNKPLNIKKLQVSGKYKYDKEYKDRKGFRGQTYVLFCAEIKKGKIIFDKKEHSGYKWVSFKKAVKMLRWENQKKCLEVVERWVRK